MKLDESPTSLGYRMPAEWEPHSATWLNWPCNLETWPTQLESVEQTYLEFIKILSQHEPVHVLAGDASNLESNAILSSAEKLVGSLPNVTLHSICTNDAWLRDCGPIFLNPSESKNANELPCPALLNWEYNAWGGKYPPFDADNKIPAQISKLFPESPLFTSNLILEGGSIDVNGEGCLLTTEECLLNPNRNPHLNREQIETVLKDHFGVAKILWLGKGIAGDDTDGHVDDLARFVSSNAIVTAIEEDKSDENYLPLQENYQRLQQMRDVHGRPFEIVLLPMPKPIYTDGIRLPATYLNFYIANQSVIVPTFGSPADKTAINILQELFPTREVIGIEARDLLFGLGAFHCISQQQPAINGTNTVP